MNRLDAFATFRISPPVILAAAWCIGLPAWGAIAGGSSGLEKVLTAMVMPVAAVFNVVLLIVLVSWHRRDMRTARIVTIPLLLLGILGNGHVGGLLCWIVESPRPLGGPPAVPRYDAIVLLGGSTRMSDPQTPALASDGHRLFLAAQLYHRGVTPRIVATGGRLVFDEDVPMYATQSRRLLESVGVPPEAITEVGGINTRAEMQELRRWFDAQGDATPDRVGLITNAAHIPRALRLAERQGLHFIPLPTAHRGGFRGPSPTSLIPSEHAIERTAIAWYEILAQLAGQ